MPGNLAEFWGYVDEEIKDIARILGIDAKHLSSEGLQRLKELFAEAYEITAFIADDKESLDMLTQFGKDYAGAQSSIEWAEFAGGGVFEIVLTALLLMFTGGVGNVAQGASKIRHAGKLKSLGSIFRSLGKLLKRKKLRKKNRVNVDTKKPVKTELPEDKKPSVVPAKKLKETDVPCFKKNAKGDPLEYDRQLKGQQKGLNDMTAKEYLDGRKAYTGDRASTTAVREKYEKNLVLDAYKEFKFKYADFLSDSINDYNFKYKNSLDHLLVKLKKINQEKYKSVVLEIEKEFQNERIEFYENWKDCPFKTLKS